MAFGRAVCNSIELISWYTVIYQYRNEVAELDKKRSGNRLTMYLEIDKSTWFFFEYHHGVMFVRSSNEEFNTILHETKEDKREFKDPLKKNPYSYIICPRSKKTKFYKKDK